MIYRQLEQVLGPAVAAALPDADLSRVQVRPCPDPKFGDYQTTALMGLAKERRQNPRQLATRVLDNLDVSQWCQEVEIAGPGFLNFRLKPAALAQALRLAIGEPRHLVCPSANPRTVVIDFSSPNVAKPMHVGHIRSTVLGDCLARILKRLGHRVITDNHIGDWGTQFGKLIVGWKLQRDDAALQQEPLAEMERLYKSVNAAGETDSAVLEQARLELVKLQNGDPENRRIWQRMIELSQHQFDAVYNRLGVSFDHVLGESFYNDQLSAVVQDLASRGLAKESDGAMMVHFDDDPSLKAHPAMVRKSDGAANYTTTDLATLLYRIETWHPEEIVYVTDGRQQLHFQQLFSIFRRWHPEVQVRLAHVWFGTILGEDGKPFRTRSGDVIKLEDLLDEAEERAFALVTEKNPDLPEPERRNIARVVGLGAVKYADLLPNRQSDYVFSWDKMLALTGNTAPYLQYACTRTRSLLRKVDTQWEIPETLLLESPEEIVMGKALLNFGLVLESAAEDYRPNYLCNYLYELASHLSRFWEACPVLKAPEPLRSSRLALCELTGRVLAEGLQTLGLETLEQM